MKIVSFDLEEIKSTFNDKSFQEIHVADTVIMAEVSLKMFSYCITEHVYLFTVYSWSFKGLHADSQANEIDSEKNHRHVWTPGNSLLMYMWPNCYCILIYMNETQCVVTMYAPAITKTRLFKYIENFTSKNWKFSDKNVW